MEFLMQAQTFKPERHSLSGMLVSEKLDGMRAFWDGGLSRDKDCMTIGYSNDTGIATRLWSRYGKIIHAPDYWLDQLPNILLDGELYLGRGRFQEVMSICRTKRVERDWREVKYMVFDSPPPKLMFASRKVTGTIFSGEISGPNFIYSNKIQGIKSHQFYSRYLWMYRFNLIIVQVVNQTEVKGSFQIEDRMKIVKSLGGEGLMLREKWGIWEPKRSHQLLKMKPWFDAEMTVTGYTMGIGKFEGMLGTLDGTWGNMEVSLGTGFSNQERLLYRELYPIGTVVTFHYLKLTDAGKPYSPAFVRVRETE